MSKSKFAMLVVGVIALMTLFGFVLPMLVSAKSGIAVMIAFAIMALLVSVVGYVLINKLKKEEVK